MSTLAIIPQVGVNTATIQADSYNAVLETVLLSNATTTSFNFTVTNRYLYPQSSVSLTAIYAGAGEPLVRLQSIGDFQFIVHVYNLSATALNAKLRINMVITPN